MPLLLQFYFEQPLWDGLITKAGLKAFHAELSISLALYLLSRMLFAIIPLKSILSIYSLWSLSLSLILKYIIVEKGAII